MNVSIECKNPDTARILFGERDANILFIEAFFDVDIHIRGTKLQIKGYDTQVMMAKKTIEGLYDFVDSGHQLKKADIEQACKHIKKNPNETLSQLFEISVPVSKKGTEIVAKTKTQSKYIQTIEEKDLVFGWGPAGTGKTYLAMAMAAKALMSKEVKRIILTRPAVEAGEKLGFLPGDMVEKVNPYLRPLYDALFDMFDGEKIQRMIETDVIEVAPLAFMRGRTLSQAFVVLDEAQNTSSEQMKMFLTRLGKDSRAVITGDVTQIDLPRGQSSGLVEALHILSDIEEIGFVQFHSEDVVRHSLVQKIINAYEKKLSSKPRHES
ncbi:MAG: PhoH family protein [Bdellovibrionales bacterium]|nr:PhoH family protein [Bdellovibrionales bacterium]